MGASSKPATQTTSTAPWAEQKPYLIQGFSEAQKLYDAGAPAYYSGSTVAAQNPYTSQANQAISNLALNGNPAVNAGQAQLMKTINGDYLNSNPYLDAMYNKAAKQTIDAYNQITNPGIDSQYSLAGRLGGNAAYATTRNQSDAAAGRQLQNLATDIYGGNYAQERQNQLNALNTAQTYGQNQMSNLGALAGVGQQQQLYNQSLTDADIARYNYNAQAPYNQLADYMGLIQGNYGGSSTQTSAAAQPSALSQGLGLALMGANIFSDINMKENIEYVGQEKGHNIYAFNYKNDPEKARYTGVMAQEVEKTRPDAVMDTPEGKMVNYGALGLTMRRI